MKTEITAALFRADIYRILALALELPTKAKIEEIKNILEECISAMPPGNVIPAEAGIQQWLQVVSSFCENDSSPLTQEYHRLFITDVVCPVFEGSYQLVERGPILGDITAFYKAFQLQFLSKEGPPDSMKMQLGFMSYLSLKEAYALEHRLLAETKITTQGEKHFLQDHLGRWGLMFGRNLQEKSTEPFYVLLGKRIEDWLGSEIKRLEANPAPLPLRLSGISEDELHCAM